jgi:2-polyprenyl-3-methyl-5-hydroxy-6-metoxy-1,4-benzoquinol methylase
MGMPNGADCPRLFVSYSHLDTSYQEEFKRHLEGRASGRSIEWWADNLIFAGADWKTEVEDAINKSSIAVCLVTENFFRSQFIRDAELPHLLKRINERRLVLIPVIIRPAAFKSSPLAHYQARPDPSKPIVDMTEGQRHRFWEDLIEEIEKLLDTAAPASWPTDNRLLPFGSEKIPFFSLADFRREPVRHRDFDVSTETAEYPLDPAASMVKLPADIEDNPSCRMVRFRCDDERSPRLLVTFAHTSYGDYLRSEALLRQPFPRYTARTFRDEFIRTLPSSPEFTRLQLSNICGVGLFVITKDSADGCALISRHRSTSHVYPDRWTFTTSGTCKWGVHPDPFMEVVRRGHLEVGHQVNLARLMLWGLGLDAEHLYFQFLFVEESNERAATLIDIANRHPDNKDKPISLQALALQVDVVIPHLLTNKWEPAAQAGLLFLLGARHGEDTVIDAYNRAVSEWKTRMRENWRDRARRPGCLADMTPRYLEKRAEYAGPPEPAEWIEQQSIQYVQAVLKFIGDDLAECDVLELGCGTGRISAELAKRARKLMCVDQCAEMIARNRKSFPREQRNVSWLTKFGQEYAPSKPYDVCVCSLVLIHNTPEAQFRSLVRAIAENCAVAFVFEDTSQRPTSEQTELRTREEL